MTGSRVGGTGVGVGGTGVSVGASGVPTATGGAVGVGEGVQPLRMPLEPGSESKNALPPLGIIGESEQHRTPVTRMLEIRRDGAKILAHALEAAA